MYEDVNAKCPFFVSASERIISCKGVIKGSSIDVRFDKVSRLPKYRYNFCDTLCWQGCPIAQMISQELKD